MATCLLYANDTLLGWADLRPTDPSMGVVSGVFYANDDYRKVQPVIWNAWDHSDSGLAHTPEGIAACADKDSLGLRVTTERGEALEQEGPIWLDDIPELPAGDMQLSVLGVPWGVLERVFGCKLSDPY